MFKIDSGGPAFPRTGFIPDTSDAVGERLRDLMNTITEPQDGMTLLDWYIGQALQGMVASTARHIAWTNPEQDAHISATVGQAAVCYAEATMVARAEYLALPRKPRPHNPEEDA